MKLTSAYVLTALVYPFLAQGVAVPQFNPSVPSTLSRTTRITTTTSHSASFTTSTVTVRSSTSSSSAVFSTSTITSRSSSSTSVVVVPSTSSTSSTVVVVPPTSSSTSQTASISGVGISSSSTSVSVIGGSGTSTSASSLATSTSASNDATFVQQMLFYHNAYRAHHGTAALSWNQTLVDAAVASASKCVFAHTTPYKYGENIAGGTYNNYAYYVYLWYNEVNQYNYNSPGFASATGHFTQLIWKGSTQLGCAWVQGCPQTLRNLLFCEYYPNGNVNGPDNYRVNVLPPQNSPANPAVPPGNR